MTKELIINAAPQGVEIALLEDKKLVELHSEKADANFAVGDLYLGKVKKLIPGLNAAFVEVGFEKDAFLTLYRSEPLCKVNSEIYQSCPSMINTEDGFDFANFKVEPEIVKTGKIAEVLKWPPKCTGSDFKRTNCCQRPTAKLRTYPYPADL